MMRKRPGLNSQNLPPTLDYSASDATTTTLINPNNLMYDPQMVQPMRDELTTLGVTELLTATDVDTALRAPGTTLVFVNSVCGCAAGSARPGLRLSLMAEKKPDQIVTVFAGMETEATARAREYFKPYRPSSPQIALMKDGQLVQMIQRQDIEGSTPDVVASELQSAYDAHCG